MVIKNGIYREKLGDGNEYLFYYVNNVRQVGTGLVQLDDGSYIYVRSGANLAVGSYYVSKLMISSRAPIPLEKTVRWS